MSASPEAWRICVQALKSLRGGDEAGARQAAHSVAQAPEELEGEMLRLSLRSTAGDPAPGHALNCAIIAVAVGRGLRWDLEEVKALAFLAVIQDRLRAKRLAARLPADEIDQELHPQDPGVLFTLSEEIARAMPAEVSAVLAQRLYTQEPATDLHAARRGGHTAADIVALCDMYETASHPRNWRDPQASDVLLLALLAVLRRSSDDAVLRAFIKKLSLFPAGALVELSSGDFAVVAAINPAQPTRPIVWVRADPNGVLKNPPLRLDLSVRPNPAVARAVSLGGGGGSRYPLLAAELAASSWWPV